MRPEDIEKLLGGYAAGTLTPAEEEALFAAALEDQALFDELAREQAIRNALRDPSARAQLLAALEERPRWWAFRRPAVILAMAGLAGVAALIALRRPATQDRVPQPVLVAQAPRQSPAADSALSNESVASTEPHQKQVRRRAKVRPAPAPTAAPAPITFAEAPRVDSVRMSAGAEATPSPVPARNQALASDAAAAAPRAGAASKASARAVFYGGEPAPGRVQGAVAAAAAAPRSIGVRYTIVRREGTEWVDTDPAGGFSLDDTLALRITANRDGEISIGGAEPVALKAMRPYLTPPLAVGVERVSVVFSGRKSAPPMPPVVAETQGSETYVAGSGDAEAIAFFVALPRN